MLNQPPGKDDHCKDQDEHSNDHHRHISGMVCMHRPGCHGVACIVWTERGSEDAICVIEKPSGPVKVRTPLMTLVCQTKPSCSSCRPLLGAYLGTFMDVQVGKQGSLP